MELYAPPTSMEGSVESLAKERRARSRRRRALRSRGSQRAERRALSISVRAHSEFEAGGGEAQISSLSVASSVS